ncbi:hypothetical protein [Pectobacterium actinidiae]|uniref:hypothetical protein n=1 Tax=Pectobacterium actinidiae TaxID=1507808 RepID=UPI00383A7086
MTTEWLDLVDDPDFPRTPLQRGFFKTGRNGLIDLLHEWREASVNHAALVMQSKVPGDNREKTVPVTPQSPVCAASTGRMKTLVNLVGGFFALRVKVKFSQPPQQILKCLLAPQHAGKDGALAQE